MTDPMLNTADRLLDGNDAGPFIFEDYAQAVALVAYGATDYTPEFRHLAAMWNRIRRLQDRIVAYEAGRLQLIAERDAALVAVKSFKSACDERDTVISELLEG